ncbi:MAG: hypothetical protein H5T86_06305 [Armatimonadetes bacterium]|nr:hypothetical protein [Armatimonadota bacterium]
MPETQIPVAWVYDELAHEAARDDWRNFWSLYVEELLPRLGLLRPQRIQRSQLAAALSPRLSALIIPRGLSAPLTDEELAALERWVRAGGMAICLAAPGAEQLIGGEVQQQVEQPGDEFSASALIEYLGRGRRWACLEPGENVRSPVISPLRIVSAPTAETLAFAVPIGGEGPSLGPAISLARLGEGWVSYWAFDLAQCAWAAMQGRPVYFDRDGDGYLRTVDAIILGEFDLHYPHVDLLLYMLRGLLGLAGLSMIDVMPPLDGQPADCLIYIGGDEEAAKGTAAWASRWMSRRGLPYHVNILPDPQGNFACTAAEVEEIRGRGHEVSLHFNMMDGFTHPSPFSEEDVRRQVEWFRARFGFTPNTVVFHWVRWVGWAEPAVWMASCGIRGDNSRLHVPGPGLNPTNRLGYGFGTALPYRPWTDWHDGNRRLDIVYQPITAYEVGYNREDESNDYSEQNLALEHAVKWRTMLNLFYHSVLITWSPACRRAIEHAQQWLEERAVRAVLVGNDRLTDWWNAREQIEVASEGDRHSVSILVNCPWPDGCVLRVPCAWRADVEGVKSDGDWLLVPCGQGKTVIALRRD